MTSRAEGLPEGLAQTVADACRIIGMEGLSRAAFGHVSMRLEAPDRFLIKTRGPEEEGLEFASVDDIVEIDERGVAIEEQEYLKPPNETALHLGVYRRRPEVGAVVHAHPPWVVLASTVELPIEPIYGAYDPSGMRLAAAGIPVFPSSVLVRDVETADAVAATMGDRDVCILKGHGVVVAGSDVQDATLKALSLEELVRMNVLASMIGRPRPISSEEIEEIEVGAKKFLTQPFLRRNGDRPVWHYLKRKLRQLG